MWRHFVRDYFTYSRKERWGIYTLLLIIVSSILLPFLLPFILPKKKYDPTEFDNAVARLRSVEDSNEAKTPYFRKYSQSTYKAYGNNGNEKFRQNDRVHEKIELFPFDPNTIPPSDWRRLGVHEKTILTIQKYIAKGGHFYKSTDISKIWGLHEDQIKRLLPYVKIAEILREHHAVAYKAYTPYRKPDIKPFDINIADSTYFENLPGIGSHLAKRIISFREKLGGFTSVEQIRETFGLSDSTFRMIQAKLLIGPSNLRKLDLNASSLENLRAHPYIRYALANAIVQYRSQHGPFGDVSGVRNIMLVSDTLYQKLSPYLFVTKK